MSSEPRNNSDTRPDLALRWAGRVLFLTALVLISDLALQPGHAFPPDLFGPDKVQHVLAFMALTVLARMGWPSIHGGVIFVVLMGYGVGIEIAQSQPWVGRTSSMADIVADGVGILVAFVGLWIFSRLRR
jgi:VanZ family protein